MSAPDAGLRAAEAMSSSSMPTCRTLGMLLLTAACAVGCRAADAGEDDRIAAMEGELGASPREAGITEGSLEEEGVLLLVNDRAVTREVLLGRTQVEPAVADAIVAFRTGPDGAPRWFSTIDEIDALPSTDTAAFQRLLADARAHGYVEPAGFDPPTLVRLMIPDGLGRPPTSDDVTVEAGFDGKSPDEVVAIVRGRLTNVVHSSNERFVEQTIRDNHKAFTIAVNNLFAPGSPPATFAESLAADELVLLGTMSAVRPTILVAVRAGVTTHYARGESGRYEPIDPPRYPVVIRARLRLATHAAGPGVRVFYPAWSAKVLSGPTSVVIEP